MIQMETAIETANVDSLTLRELKAIYEIGSVILQSVDTVSALKEIVRLARPVFIFDNIVLYQTEENKSLNPTYAKSVGRGRSVEADMAWGEAVAVDVIEGKEIIIRQENVDSGNTDRMFSRLDSRYFLGLPLKVDEKIRDVLVFIRFGGPDYLPEQVNLAMLIGAHVEQLLVRQHLMGKIVSLEAERQLDRLQQEFVAAISHDLRSPLGFIKGYATTLLRDDAEWDAQTSREFLTIIDEEADRLSELIENLLDSSRLQTGTLRMVFQEVHLRPLLQDLVHRIQGSEYSIKTRLILDETHTAIWADPTRLIQVFDNLLNNAEKHAPNSEVTITLQWEDNMAHFIVQDTGDGIPKKHLENIFKRFYRLPKSDVLQGSGLGLFICRQIVQAHNGKIYAEACAGAGATFHIFLPRSHSQNNPVNLTEEV